MTDARELCQDLLCRRVRDVCFVSAELGEMRFERAAKRGRGVLLWGTSARLATTHVFALLLRGGHAETSLPRPRAVPPTFCIFLDCAAVLRLDEEPRLIDWKTDVLRRNAMLARRCWTCEFRWCCATGCNHQHCARCGKHNHTHMACAPKPAPGHASAAPRLCFAPPC
jgi:hypothetical protein